jgi:hypothetical protein
MVVVYREGWALVGIKVQGREKSKYRSSMAMSPVYALPRTPVICTCIK